MITATCPICARKMHGQTRDEWPDWPFCSARCRLVDLGRWLGEEYRLPVSADGQQDFTKSSGAETDES